MSERVRLTRRQLLDTMRQVVREFGEDYVYPQQEESVRRCQYEYVNEAGVKVRCLIGEVLFRLVPAEVWDEIVSERNSVDAVEVCRTFVTVIDVDDDDEYFVHTALRAAQAIQDDGGTWGTALDNFEDRLLHDALPA